MLQVENYVGVTGFMSRAEVDAVLSVAGTRKLLMCGVLVSTKSLRGERNKWHRRYPTPETIANIFSDDKRCLNLIHAAIGEDSDVNAIERLVRLGGPNLHGFQFNGRWPAAGSLRRLKVDCIVLQCRPNMEIKSEKGMMSDAMSLALRASVMPATDVLIDTSGGKGQPLDLKRARIYVDTMRKVAPSLGVGVAGGFSAEELSKNPAIGALVREFKLHVDAEGRLRDGDEGGVLNVDRAKAWVQAASAL